MTWGHVARNSSKATASTTTTTRNPHIITLLGTWHPLRYMNRPRSHVRRHWENALSTKVTAMPWQVEFSEVSAKLVALKLADCASDLGDSIFPSVNTIVRHTGCAQSTVRKWLFAMEHCGLLRVV